MVAGSTVATIVMALCFFYQEVDVLTAAIRVGWAFVVSYAAAFFLVRIILRTTIYEFVVQERERKAKRKSDKKAAQENPAPAVADATLR